MRRLVVGSRAGEGLAVMGEALPETGSMEKIANRQRNTPSSLMGHPLPRMTTSERNAIR